MVAFCAVRVFNILWPYIDQAHRSHRVSPWVSSDLCIFFASHAPTIPELSRSRLTEKALPVELTPLPFGKVLRLCFVLRLRILQFHLDSRSKTWSHTAHPVKIECTELADPTGENSANRSRPRRSRNMPWHPNYVEREQRHSAKSLPVSLIFLRFTLPRNLFHSSGNVRGVAGWSIRQQTLKSGWYLLNFSQLVWVLSKEKTEWTGSASHQFGQILTSRSLNTEGERLQCWQNLQPTRCPEAPTKLLSNYC